MRTVLYIAFAAVTLWLLWEVLMQYKARLRWRAVALAGFLLVAAGLFVLGSRIVIGLGAVLFAWGQIKVTMSYRSGFSDGWALGPHPEEDEEDDRPRGRRRPSEEYDGYEEPAPLPKRAGTPYEDVPAQQEPAPAAFSPFGGGPQAAPAAAGAAAGYDGYGNGYDTGSYATTGYDTGGYSTVGGYAQQGQDNGQIYAQNDSYAGYSDPYSGTQYAATPTYYDSGTGGYDTGAAATYDSGSYPTAGGYDQQQQYTDPGYAAQGGYDPSYGQQGGYAQDGTWVPQQSEGYDSGQYPTQQPGYPGYEEQYRY
ncbi:hypothetical protein AB0M28_23245 [Streptomyces sp. NPDC051940]|uniref:hypothetical protein n=1 Tax=Streptomyces sp. NPDC051940 TaxID=3155675 RepID=UPI00343C2CF2